MKVILIDDEPIALEVLEHMLSPYEEINIIGRYTKYTDALESLKEEKPDVIFLDIEMGEMNGLELAEVFMGELDRVEIVFVTAYSEYAVDAFELNAIDYLLKPIQEKRLLKAVERLGERMKTVELEDPAKLKVFCFGGFQVMDGKGKALGWRTQKAKELFAYLWNGEDKPVNKNLIMEDIFPDKDLNRATTLLHTTIYQIRKNLEAVGYSNGITYLDEAYKLDIPTTGDREKLNEIISRGRYEEEDIKEILWTFKGDFLEEGYLWGIERQQIYRQIILEILSKFGEKQVENNRLSLITKISLDKALEIDPLNELTVKTMINYYGKKKETNNLINFFRHYKLGLRDEMDLEPEKNIINLYNKYIK